MKAKRSLVIAGLAVMAGVIIFMAVPIFYTGPIRYGSQDADGGQRQSKDNRAVNHGSAWSRASRILSNAWDVVPGLAELAASVQGLKRDWDDSGKLTALLREWNYLDDERRRAMVRDLTASLEEPAICDLLTRLNGLAAEELCLELQRALFERLAELDPPRAAILAEELLQAEQREKTFLRIAQRWCGTDPAAATDWALNLEPSPVREEIIRSMAERLVSKVPSTAGKLIAALDGPDRRNLLHKLALEWGTQDFGTALAWARELPEGADKAQYLMHLGYQWERQDVREALRFAEALPEGQDDLVVSLATRWVKRDAQAAADWAASLPEGSRRDKIIASLTAAWATQDLAAASQFVMGLPSGTAQQEATISVISAWSAIDPVSAAQWVEQLPDGRLRDYAAENVAFHWSQSDAAQAAAWLACLKN